MGELTMILSEAELTAVAVGGGIGALRKVIEELTDLRDEWGGLAVDVNAHHYAVGVDMAIDRVKEYLATVEGR